MKPQTSELVFFYILLGVVGYFAFMIMQPYLTALFLAAVLAVMFLPLFRLFVRKMRGNRTAAALSTVFLVLAAVLIPVIYVGSLMFEEVLGIYNSLDQSNFDPAVLRQWFGQIEIVIQHVVPGFHFQHDIYAYMIGYLQGILAWAGNNLSVFVSGLVGFLFEIFIIIIAMFFFYRDGEKLKEFAIKWSPLADTYDESIISKLDVAISSVIKGALTVALAQGLMVGVGFSIFHVPNPVLWGVVGSVAALVPFVGTTLITIPAVAILYFSGSTVAAMGLLIWSLTCVGLADNVLGPMLIKRGVHIHPLFILLSVFGGLVYFGPIGFLAGPIVMAFFFALLDIYPVITMGRTVNPQNTIL